MIPAFVKEGFLPPGIHCSDITEFRQRFAYTIWRSQLFDCLIRLMHDLKSIGCRSVYVDGSYTSNKRFPSDIDVCWEDIGIDYEMVKVVMPILFELDYPRVAQQALYKADIFPAHLMERSSGLYFIDFFQKDKDTKLAKGIVKLEIA